jgi:uncharacterized protein YdhG (YjbR/CyaY superfamily)
MNLIPIERRTGLTKKEFQEEYLKKNKPVIFTDLASNWPAVEKWTFNFFKSNYGHLEVPLYDNKFREAGKGYLNSRIKMRFGDYLDIISKEPTDLRMFLYNIMAQAPELRNDISIPTITNGFIKKLPLVFFGGEGARVDLHYDLDCANVFLTHFQTRKKVILFAPDQTALLYQHPFTVQSSVRLDQTDFEKHPALQKANGFEDTLHHGETVFMPSLYWHYLEYTDPGFSLALRTHSTYTKMRGIWNINRHFVVDKSMNYLLGNQWKTIKENLAVRKAERAVKELQETA